MLKENVLMLIPLILDGPNQTDKPLNNCPLYFCSKLNKILQTLTFSNENCVINSNLLWSHSWLQ